MQPSVPSPVRILIFDDDAIDAELIRRSLRRHHAGYETLHVSSDQEYLAALRSFSPDVILSDYKLPLHGGAFALQMACEWCPEVPFLFVSGVLQDPLAAELLQRGARAFVSKSDLRSLGATVEKSLEEARETRRVRTA